MLYRNLRMKKPSTVIVASSHVSAGAVGGRVSGFVLESLGFRVVAVPTVLLSWHPGVGPSTRVVPDQFADVLADLADAPWLGDVAAVLSGYLGEPDQAAAVASLVGAVRLANPDTVYVCDPVIGDIGGLYVPAATAHAIRERLVPLADVITPNVAELAWLSSRASGPTDIGAARTAATALGVRETVVTSLSAGTGRTGAAVFSAPESRIASHPELPGETRGAGDLFAARYLAARLAGDDTPVALRCAAAATFAFVTAAQASDDGALPLAGNAALLSGGLEDVALAEPR